MEYLFVFVYNIYLYNHTRQEGKIHTHNNNIDTQQDISAATRTTTNHLITTEEDTHISTRKEGTGVLHIHSFNNGSRGWLRSTDLWVMGPGFFMTNFIFFCSFNLF